MDKSTLIAGATVAGAILGALLVPGAGIILAAGVGAGVGAASGAVAAKAIERPTPPLPRTVETIEEPIYAAPATSTSVVTGAATSVGPTTIRIPTTETVKKIYNTLPQPSTDLLDYLYPADHALLLTPKTGTVDFSTDLTRLLQGKAYEQDPQLTNIDIQTRLDQEKEVLSLLENMTEALHTGSTPITRKYG